MPQGPLLFTSATLTTNPVTIADPTITVANPEGGASATLNMTAAAAIKATAGRVARVVVVNGGTTGGTFTLNDCATTGAANAGNTIFSIAYGAAAGSAYVLNWPCATGIVLSAVPTGGTPILAVSWT